MTDPFLGLEFDGYRVLSMIDEGGMGRIYEALTVETGEPVALKIVRRDAASPRVLKRFRREFDILGRLDHPNIARLKGAGVVDGGHGAQAYLAIELVRGKTLIDHAEEDLPSVDRRLEIFFQIIDAIQHANEHGVIHRDLKPENVMISDRGAVKVLDFGIGRILKTRSQKDTMLTAMGDILGTLDYMSPEQLAGDSTLIDIRADVYGLGCLGYELLTDRLPFDCDGVPFMRAIEMIETHPVPPMNAASLGLPAALDAIFEKALAKSREERWDGAAAFGAAIGDALAAAP